MKTINTYTQEAPRILSTRNVKKTIPEFIKIKFLKTRDKEKILKAARDFHLQPTQSNSDSTFQDTKATKDSERNHR